ncbi:hypothetical protein [Actinoplanes sp. NBRC 103695]|uniref:hypothetical protein n=1 Tax=Actinoplanes sp. NBRC 103695 TaxID=3032202 RepID=UPI002554E43A|nr:hypothetical protein [Actinoplanes sp. NBRC 103695]
MAGPSRGALIPTGPTALHDRIALLGPIDRIARHDRITRLGPIDQPRPIDRTGPRRLILPTVMATRVTITPLRSPTRIGRLLTTAMVTTVRIGLVTGTATTVRTGTGTGTRTGTGTTTGTTRPPSGVPGKR